MWTCFYDTSGDPARDRSWYSCTVSRDGLTWAMPRRVAPLPSSASALWEDARLAGFDDHVFFGGYTSVVAANGVAHPMWIDTSNQNGLEEEVFTGRLTSAAFGLKG